MPAVLYARFSTDLQRAESIADQLVVCRRQAETLGIAVVGTFEDAAVSGASLANRPGLLALMAAAERGEFDLVITEALDRISRSQADTAAVFEDLRFHGVAIHTLAEGRISELHVGLKGTMNALALQEIARKTRRGLQGVAREGRHTGGRVYGYRRIRDLDAQGELRRGLLEIDQSAAAVIETIFRQYANGASPRAIAADLNRRGIPGPRGGAWNASTINGNVERGNGILHNELYRGVQVFGRNAWVKDRRTGARRCRTGDQSEIIRTSVPHLRIVSDALWAEARARHEAVRLGPLAKRPEVSRRPKHLLSGLLECGCCGAPLVRSGSNRRFVCSHRRERGAAVCANGRGFKGDELEDRVLTALRDRLLAPDLVQAAVAEIHQEANALAKQTTLRRAGLERDLQEVVRKAERLIDQVADGVLTGIAIKDRLETLEVRRSELEVALAAETAPTPISYHPAAADHYRRIVDELATVLQRTDSEAAQEAREITRGLIRSVIVTPLEERGQFSIVVKGEIAALVSQERDTTKVVAGAGFEPATFRL